MFQRASFSVFAPSNMHMFLIIIKKCDNELSVMQIFTTIRLVHIMKEFNNNVECCTAVCDSYHICIQRLQAVGGVGLPSLPRLQIFFLMFPVDPVAHCCICEVVCSVYTDNMQIFVYGRRTHGCAEESSHKSVQRSGMGAALVPRARSLQ